MISNKVLILAPSHEDNDWRVMRTALALYGKYNVELVVDETGYVDLPSNLRITRHKMAKRNFWKIVFPNIHEYIAAARDSIVHSRLVYIHSSAIEGLLLCLGIKRRYREKCVILDYHDSYEYEFYYQLSKILNIRRTLSKVIYRVMKTLYLRWVSSSITKADGFIGISDIQLNALLGQREQAVARMAIQNIRGDIPLSQKYKPHGTGVEIVHLGNIAEGKGLERIAASLHGIEEIRVRFFGTVRSIHVKKKIERLDGSWVFEGRYSSDREVRDKLKGLAIGIYLGIDDPTNTSINEMSSTNKVFSYLNIGIPMILSENLINMRHFFGNNRIAYFVKSEEDAKEAIQNISANYDSYQKSIHDFVKVNLNESELRARILNFVSKAVNEEEFACNRSC